MSLYLVNYRHPASAPLKSIMHLPREEAFAVAARLYKASQCGGHRRFGPDFPDYYQYRIKVEALLYKQFCALGGQPELTSPFYFVLERSPLYASVFDCAQAVRIALDAIDPACVSFTYGDSMRRMEVGADTPMLTVDSLNAEIAQHGGIDAFLDRVLENHSCIEAQVWTLRGINAAEERKG